MYTVNQLAFNSPAFPCNPLPFLNELFELVKAEGTNTIRSDKAKMLLLTINQISYGQAAIIDTFEEYCRLKALITMPVSPIG